jgi:hypothetical protein
VQEETKLKLLPVSVVGGDISAMPVLAAETWIHGPTKPRHVLREEEIPTEDVSLDKLAASLSYLEILPDVEVRVNVPEDVRKSAFFNADALVIDGLRSVFSGKELFVMKELALLGKPIVAAWDSWGFAWEGFMLREYLAPFGCEPLISFDAADVKTMLRALRGWKALQELRALYIGDIPSHSVLANLDLVDIHHRLGPILIHRPLEDYETTVEGVPDNKARSIAQEWQSQYRLLDERDRYLPELARVYLALKDMLTEHEANGLTVDCAFLPDVNLAPCFAFSLLIDQGIPCGCEGDTNALMMMTALMGISGRPALMGNLFENATHSDIEENIISINHDVVPPGMSCRECQLTLRDFHESRKGLTGYVELEKDSPVTVVGMNVSSTRIWATLGKVAWTKDTAHCRTSIGIRVQDAKNIGRRAFGHHQAIAYGDYRKELAIIAQILALDLEII